MKSKEGINPLIDDPLRQIPLSVLIDDAMQYRVMAGMYEMEILRRSLANMRHKKGDLVKWSKMPDYVLFLTRSAYEKDEYGAVIAAHTATMCPYSVYVAGSAGEPSTWPRVGPTILDDELEPLEGFQSKLEI